jgi:hypothetical protein
MKEEKKGSLKRYFTWGLPLLGLMATLFMISLIVTLILHYWF